jgi:hypothetical protein
MLVSIRKPLGEFAGFVEGVCVVLVRAFGQLEIGTASDVAGCTSDENFDGCAHVSFPL